MSPSSTYSVIHAKYFGATVTTAEVLAFDNTYTGLRRVPQADYRGEELVLDNHYCPLRFPALGRRSTTLDVTIEVVDTEDAGEVSCPRGSRRWASK